MVPLPELLLAIEDLMAPSPCRASDAPAAGDDRARAAGQVEARARLGPGRRAKLDPGVRRTRTGRDRGL